MSTLPYLRRYARALTGSAEAGDELVALTIERLTLSSAATHEQDPKASLFAELSEIWRSISRSAMAAAASGPVPDRLARLTPLSRQAFLLVALEGFDLTRAARILAMPVDDFAYHLTLAREEIAKQVATDILIIEDELFIALDLERLVKALGHRVSAIVRTRTEAVAAAAKTKPGLILADIQLADESTGIEAVTDILHDLSVPVIFITAFPERLLTGATPEPTFVITKPFDQDLVRAVVSQALYFGDNARIPSSHGRDFRKQLGDSPVGARLLSVQVAAWP